MEDITMTENMKVFMDIIQNNIELKEKFDEIGKKEQAEQKDYTDEVISLAKDCGITLTKEDFELDEGELSDEDLKNVSGGGTRFRPILKPDQRKEFYRAQKEKKE